MNALILTKFKKLNFFKDLKNILNFEFSSSFTKLRYSYLLFISDKSYF